MNDQPLVTVNILSFNRRDELRNTLTKVFEQDYKNIEVIVVDNASSDGSAYMVKAEFPSVKLIRIQKNIGIAGWNEGFKVAKGEYVLVLDDDAYPDFGSITKSTLILIQNRKIGLVAYNIIDKSRNLSETQDFSPPYKDFVGCGALIRKSCIDLIGGFDQRFFIYAHETDFSIRLLNAGYSIEYCNDAIAFHRNLIEDDFKPAFSNYRFIYQTVSFIQLLNKYLPSVQVKKILIKLLLNRFLVALYYCKLNDFIKLVKIIYKESFNEKRTQIKNEILALYNFNPEIFNKYYFNKLLQGHSRAFYPLLYLKTFFYPPSKKKSFLV